MANVRAYWSQWKQQAIENVAGNSSVIIGVFSQSFIGGKNDPPWDAPIDNMDDFLKSFPRTHSVSKSQYFPDFNKKNWEFYKPPQFSIFLQCVCLAWLCLINLLGLALCFALRCSWAWLSPVGREREKEREMREKQNKTKQNNHKEGKWRA